MFVNIIQNGLLSVKSNYTNGNTSSALKCGGSVVVSFNRQMSVNFGCISRRHNSFLKTIVFASHVIDSGEGYYKRIVPLAKTSFH